MITVNRRAMLFVKLAKLFTDLSSAVRIRDDMTPEQQTEVAKLLHKEFTKIMNKYDREKK